MTGKGILLIVVLVAMLVLSGAYATFVWFDLGDVDVSGHGNFALTLGVVFSFLIGGGLMVLTFFSNRSGHDDKV
jgi:hypothetical protein